MKRIREALRARTAGITGWVIRAGLLCAMAPPGLAQNDPGFELLTKALGADRVLTYRAECDAESFDPFNNAAVPATRISFIEIVDGPNGLRRTEYQAPPRLANNIVVEGPRFVYQWDQGRGVALRQEADAGRMLPAAFDDRLTLLRQNYVVSVVGGQRVANRDCIIVEIMPKPHRLGNPWRRLFVDRAKSLPLRVENANGAGLLTNTRTVRGVAFDFPVDPEMFAVPDNIQVKVDPMNRGVPGQIDAALARDLGFEAFQPAYLPDGYVFAGAQVLKADGAKAVHLMYFDGLSTISLFEEQSGRANGTGGWGNGGPFAHALQWKRHGITMTLIGDILPQELVKMRDSIP